jgi:hypothetical protein
MPGIATERAAATRGDAIRSPKERDYGCEVSLAGGLPVPLGATVAMEWSPGWCHLMVQSSRAEYLVVGYPLSTTTFPGRIPLLSAPA